MASDDSGADAPVRVLDLDVALDELFGSDLDEFVVTRKRLARELRDGGDATAARALEAARRPTKSAGALNVLARRRPELVAALLERSEELRVAQDRAVAGEPGAQRDATRAQREALRDAADAAVAILGGSGEAARAEILSTLQGAAADEAFGELLRQGRLERTEVAASGFPDDPGGGEVVPAEVLADRRSRRAARREPTAGESQPRATATDRSDRLGKVAAREAERRRERALRAEADRRRAADELEQAEVLLQRATDDVAAASVQLRDTEARVEGLRGDLEAARLELRDAKDRVAATARELARRRRDVARRRG